jgi:hypothetical protein
MNSEFNYLRFSLRIGLRTRMKVLLGKHNAIGLVQIGNCFQFGTTAIKALIVIGCFLSKVNIGL